MCKSVANVPDDVSIHELSQAEKRQAIGDDDITVNTSLGSGGL